MHISRAVEPEGYGRRHGLLHDSPRHHYASEHYSSYFDDIYYPPLEYDRRDPGRYSPQYHSQPARTYDDLLPKEMLYGLDELSLKDDKPEKVADTNALPPSPAAGIYMNPQTAEYHEVRYNSKAPATWSQTRRIQHLNRPIIPVAIKIPLSKKHLWWESPSITLNMFAPYSTSLVKGTKTIETRNYQLPNKCKGVRIGIVEIMPKGLPSKKPELIGEVVFVDCKEYTSREQWERDAPYHKVDVNDQRFGWKKNKKKYGWVVHTWQSYDKTIRQAASEHCNNRVHYTKNFFVWAYV